MPTSSGANRLFVLKLWWDKKGEGGPEGRYIGGRQGRKTSGMAIRLFTHSADGKFGFECVLCHLLTVTFSKFVNTLSLHLLHVKCVTVTNLMGLL